MDLFILSSPLTIDCHTGLCFCGTLQIVQNVVCSGLKSLQVMLHNYSSIVVHHRYYVLD